MPRAAALLSIDVDAEIRKLCGRQYSSRSETLVELLRVMIRFNAKRIEITVRGKRTQIIAHGGHLSPVLLKAMCTIRDTAATHDERHAALTACEREGVSALLALLATSAVSIRSPGGTLGISPEAAWFDASKKSTDLVVSLPQGGNRRADAPALKRACRYARLPIFFNRRRVSHGDDLGDVLGVVEFNDDDLQGLVSLPRDGDVCHGVYLAHEIVARETYGLSPRGNVHLAVLRDTSARTADEVRRSELSEKTRAARHRLHAQLEERYTHLEPEDRRVFRDNLFRRAQMTCDSTLLGRLPLFRRLAGAPVDIATLRGAVNDGVLLAVDIRASQRRERWIGDPTRIFVFDQPERSFLAGSLDCRIAEPPLRGRGGWPERLMRGSRRMVRATAGAWRGVRYALLAGGAVDSAELSGAERRWVVAVGILLEGGRYRLPGLSLAESRQAVIVVMERGVLPARVIRRGGRARVLIPRGDLRIRAMAAALDDNPTSLYPAMAVLFGGHDGFGGRKDLLQQGLLASRAGHVAEAKV